ncbi:hypothetical protein J007_02836 [Cryptococcus neoformans]|nr:hypothetical protein J007_02836 [Cryptococcus neoformans var. grubii]OXC61671.1 hypothetical protein C358_02915 [Cryptococcus neoformans var. grubii MW-RSA852]
MDILDEPLPGHMESISAFRTLLKSPSDRVTCPDSVARPAEPDALQTSAIESWKATEPSRESRLSLLRLLNDLTYIINSKYKGYEEGGLKRYWVDVFGSVSWAGDTGHSGDLDLIVLDRKLLHGYAPVFWRTPPGEPPSTPVSHKRNNNPTPLKHLPEVYDTFSMAECLREAGFEDVESIAAASTPINKFKYRDQECDLNVNDLGGWYNSSLLLHYCRLAPYVLRPMVHALKLWASSHKLNDPSGAKGPATMSSYCLTLMAIAYLQHIGHLPNLQANINVPEVCRPEDTSEHDVVWVSWGKEQGVKAHVGFSLSPPDDWKPLNPNLTAADAIRGFFEFFSLNGSAPLRGERFDRVTQIVSILQGGIVPRAKEYGQEVRESQQRRDTLFNLGISLERIRQSEDMIRHERFKEEERMGKGDRGIQPRNWGEKKLVVQDPFLWFKNCAGMMSRDGLDRWWATVDNTHRVIKLKGKNFTLADLLML